MAFDAEVEKIHPALGITDVQESNLHKLAAYLLALPKDYKQFTMSHYMRLNGAFQCIEIEDPQKLPCNTVACAVGHGPIAGITAQGEENWNQYAERVFLGSKCFVDNGDCEGPYGFLFNGFWAHVDNTPQGAAKRILYWLEHGLPEDHAAQRSGDAPLCYV